MGKMNFNLEKVPVTDYLFNEFLNIVRIWVNLPEPDPTISFLQKIETKSKKKSQTLVLKDLLHDFNL